MRRLLLIILAAAALVSCSEEFSPTVEGPRPFAVFALLQTALDSQVVRVQETSPPATRNPGNPTPASVSVNIYGPNATQPFEPVTLTPDPGSVDTASFTAFAAAPFTPQRGGMYTIVVGADGRTATGTMRVPSAGSISPQDIIVLQSPFDSSPDRSIGSEIYLGPEALGFALKFFISYEVLRSGVWTPEVREVPLFFTDPSNPEKTAVFASLTRRANLAINNSIRGIQGLEYVQYRNRVYRHVLETIYQDYGTPNLRMRRAVFVLYQADTNFFTYFSFANFFQDQYTIRVDQPDYSNLDGALGFFGAITTDSAFVALPFDLHPH